MCVCCRCAKININCCVHPHQSCMYHEATPKKKGITIGGQEYTLQPKSIEIWRNLSKFIEFSRAVNKATAPADIAEWKKQADIISTEVKDASAPGFCAGGYHHLWLERITRKIEMSTRGRKARGSVAISLVGLSLP